MGIGLFVAARVARISPEQVLRSVLPFMVPLLIGLLVITAFPQLTLWLPNLVFGKLPG
jgi:TRAP-type C4-dicarboxylate transport system permease large subunit